MEMQVVPAIAKAAENLFRELVFGVFGFGLIFGFFSQGTRQPACAGGFFCCQKGHSFRSSSLSLRYTDNEGTARYMVVKVPKDIFEKNIRRPRTLYMPAHKDAFLCGDAVVPVRYSCLSRALQPARTSS